VQARGLRAGRLPQILSIKSFYSPSLVFLRNGTYKDGQSKRPASWAQGCDRFTEIPEPRWPGRMYTAQRAHHLSMGTAPGWSPDQRPRFGKPTPWPALAAIRMDRLRFAHPTDYQVSHPE